MVSSTLITIGKITKNQGNKGEVRVMPTTSYPERYEFLERVFLVKGPNAYEKRIDSIRFYKKFVILKLEGVNDIEQALNIRDYLVKIPKTELLPLQKDEYYIDDLIGYKVYIAEGGFLGNVTEIIATGGTDIFLLKGKNKEYMIPAAKEIISMIDQKERKMIVRPIPGLLEL